MSGFQIPYYLIALVSLLEDYDVGSLGPFTGGDIEFLLSGHCQSLSWWIDVLSGFLLDSYTNMNNSSSTM